MDDAIVGRARLAKLRKPCNKPHVVILGAGASLAAFPNGDRNGRRLPLMNNVVEILGLERAVAENGFDPRMNFEELYTAVHAEPTFFTLKEQIEEQVMAYFSELELPEGPTLYDLLLLSLRKKDVVFTFNWDPFLVDAYARNAEIKSFLPTILHLHGNVRLSYCSRCRQSKLKSEHCGRCGRQMQTSKLLFPIAQKNYANDPFIRTTWKSFKQCFNEAFHITIFGYGAPESDREAKKIMHRARRVDDPETRPADRIEIVDIDDEDTLTKKWSSLAYFDHYDIRRSFFDSSLAKFPRRTCEYLKHTGIHGRIVKRIEWIKSLDGVTLESVRESLADMFAAEGYRP